MSIRSKSKGGSKTTTPQGNNYKIFNRQVFDIVVDIPYTEGLEDYIENLDDLDIICSIDDEDVFSHTYQEREKKMRVSI
jgi:hypothetical protein